jgi:hypothetical protein
MKSTIIMPKESRSKKKKGRSLEIKVEGNAVRTLRTLGNEEAFHFYEAMGKPTGQSARSLQDFLDKIESVKLESLVFHHERKDFKNWIANTLEDPKLAQEIETIPKKHNSQIKTEICATVKARLKELEGISIQVHEPATVYTSRSNQRYSH